MRHSPWAAWLRDLRLLMIAADPEFTIRQRLALGSATAAAAAVLLL